MKVKPRTASFVLWLTDSTDPYLGWPVLVWVAFAFTLGLFVGFAAVVA